MTWPRVQLSELCDQIIDCINKTAPTVDHETPFRMIRTTNVRNGYVDLTVTKYVTEETYALWTRRGTPLPGDVILTREAPLGEVGMLRSNEPVFLGQRLVMYRAAPERLNQHYLLYAMLHPDVKSQIKSFGSGATVEHMRVPDCGKIEIPLPPLNIQQKIAAVLSAYDDLIQNNNQRIQLLNRSVRLVYDEWFQRYRHPDAMASAFADSPDGPTPEGWEVRRLSDLTTLISRGVSPRYDPTASEIVVNQKCIRTNRVSLAPARRHTAKVPAQKYIQHGDVLINSTGVGTLGRTAQVYREMANTTVDSHVTIVRPDLDVILPDFFGLALMARETEIEKLGVGSTGQTELGRARLAELKQIVPPMALQKSFAQRVGPQRSLVENLVDCNERLQRSRDLLLPSLVSGHPDLTFKEVDVSRVIK